jgi:1-acyl-sn-glycerol-3-phosphate acyltransferase
MYYSVVRFLRKLIKVFRLLKIEGKQNLPEDSRFIVTCTHKGWVDVIMLAVAMYPTQVHFMAKKELFDSKFMNKLMRSINAFPVNRENPGPSSLKVPLKLLKEKKCVGIFPSGTRASENITLKRGAVIISIKANAPLIPASYTGPRNFKDILKGQKARIAFGKGIKVKMENNEKEEIIKVLLKELESEFERLGKGDKKIV